MECDMNLDDLGLIKQVDSANMLQHIEALADHLADSWALGQLHDLPAELGQVRQVVIAGMGGSSISGELAARLIEDSSRVPVFVNRDYDLPLFAAGSDTLVIALSHSGNTEETLSATRCAIERETRLLAITTGGNLAPFASEAGGTVCVYQYDAPPRAALGWLYGQVLAVLSRLNIAPDLAGDVREAVSLMQRSQPRYSPDTPTTRNIAKRIAGQLVERFPVIWGAGLLAPVARRWKTQMNENAKTAAFFELLPELNHNAVVGVGFPSDLMHKLAIMQLRSPAYDHTRVAIRHQATHDLFLQEGILTDLIDARGESRLAQQMSLIQLGDYVSYYLALANQADPTPIGPIDTLKAKLAGAG
jgi:glucose/mannose-6-phosphate isomerase